jgi:hypothetical protein
MGARGWGCSWRWGGRKEKMMGRGLFSILQQQFSGNAQLNLLPVREQQNSAVIT